MAHEPVNSFVIEVLWDEEAEVWVAESDGVPGLIAEADSRTHLIEKLAVLIPELLELNNVATDAQKPLDITLRFRREAEQREENPPAESGVDGGIYGSGKKKSCATRSVGMTHPERAIMRFGTARSTTESSRSITTLDPAIRQMRFSSRRVSKDVKIP
jgi:hypothetical protein